MYRLFSTLVLVSVIMIPSQLVASSSGVTQRSTLTSAGCGTGTCHGAQPSSTVTVSLAQAVEGRVTVAPGSTTTLSVLVRHASLRAAGVNISVATALNGNMPAGTLAPAGLGSGLRATQGQLTHSFPKNMSSGEAKFDFTWTAPTEEGTYFLHAVGNAVNSNGVPTGDQWNWLEPIELVVSATNSVSETTVAMGAAHIAPVPAHGDVSIAVPVQAGERLTVQIMDASGSVIRSEQTRSNTDHFVYVWDGRTSTGAAAPSGTYTVAVINGRRIHTGRAVIMR